MSLSNLQKNLHLLWRAGFGPSIADVSNIHSKTPAQLWQRLVQDSQQLPEAIFVSIPKMDKAAIDAMASDAEKKTAMQGVQTQRKIMLQRLSSMWLEMMATSRAQLREKMAFFWHGHFATRINQLSFNRELVQIFREGALGNFGDLLLKVSKSPAMLTFLNNRQNRKEQPNENFAREVMELFTMGRGNYTEKDVKEGARAFTGWSYMLVPEMSDDPRAGEADFVFRARTHDDGLKTFLGKTGNFNGEDIIRILLQQRQTARFITTKVYRFFVNDAPDKTRIETLSKTFYDSGYDIQKLLNAIFTAPWFFEEKNVGSRIKSPIELLVGMKRALPVEMGNPRGWTVLQSVLGQTLLQPPNVAGWPSGLAWIDSSSLLVRMELPTILAGMEDLQVAPKPDDDVQMGKKLPEDMLDQKPAISPRLLQSRVDWARVETGLQLLTEAQTASLLLIRPENAPVEVAKTSAAQAPVNTRRRTYILRLMSLPEYQLC